MSLGFSELGCVEFQGVRMLGIQGFPFGWHLEGVSVFVVKVVRVFVWVLGFEGLDALAWNFQV